MRTTCILLFGLCLSALAESQYAFTNLAGLPGGPGSADGSLAVARFRGPYDLTADSQGNIYVADRLNSLIRKISPAGLVTTVAGVAGQSGTNDGPAALARFSEPSGVVADAEGNLYVADNYNHTIRRISVAGTVTTLAGAPEVQDDTDGHGSQARFSYPSSLAFGPDGHLYVTDSYNHRIRRVTLQGMVTTFAGSSRGSADGPALEAQFRSPDGLAFDAVGNLVVADTGNHTLRRISLAGQVTTLAGSAGLTGAADGTGENARFNGPTRLALDGTDLYVTDAFNHSLRRVTSAGEVSTVAGQPGVSGYVDGPAAAALFDGPNGILHMANGEVLVSEWSGHFIRKLSTNGQVSTFAGLPAGAGFANGTGTEARFQDPSGVWVSNTGGVTVVDRTHTLRHITASGVTTTLAGAAWLGGTNDGVGPAARFRVPVALAGSPDGTLFVADQNNHVIRKVAPDLTVATLAGGHGVAGAVDATGLAARFRSPMGVLFAPDGLLYVADTGNHTLRKIGADGQVTTLAGLSGSQGSKDGFASAARFRGPRGLAWDREGFLYVADTENHTIRRVATNGNVTTWAGKAGEPGATDGFVSAARFNRPTGIAVDTAGNVFIADRNNHLIRMIDTNWMVTTIGGSAGREGGVDGVGSAALFSNPEGIAVDAQGSLYIADTGNHRVVHGTLPLAGGELSFANAVGMTRVTEGVFRTWLQGASGSTVAVEASADLNQWTNLQNVVLTADGVEVAVPTYNTPSLFLRARVVP
ncbi:MAG TPA: NHL repeat-containing protein [Verrucomicrobiae bacterium]